MTMEVSNYAVRQCKMLYQLSISEIKEDVDVDIETLFRALEEHGHNITELEFSYVKLQDGSRINCHLLEMPTVLGRLTSLRLNVENYSLVLETLGNLCSNLRHLDLEYCYPLCKEELNVLLFGLKDSLISLKLPSLRAEQQEEIQFESSPFMHCNILEKLWLYGGLDVKDIMTIGQLVTLKELKFEQPNFGVTGEDYKNAFEQLKCLQHLELHLYEDQMFEKKSTLLALLKSCPNLTYWSCHNFQVSGFEEAVADCGPNTIKLQKLAFRHCTLGMRDLKAVLSLDNLKELHMIRPLCLWDEREFYNAAFEQVKLISLETLTLESCHDLDSKGFKALMKGTTKLQNVKLCYLHRIKGYTAIFAECNLEHLETFQAVSCSGLLASDVDVLKQTCPKLRDIDWDNADYNSD
jgi:hypothetical protein